MPARRTLLIAASAALVAGTLSGCGGSDEPSKNTESSTVRPGSDPKENATIAQRYFEAVASNDADLQSDGLEFTAPDSPAASYLTFLADSSMAYAGSDVKREPGTLTEVPGGYKVCAPAGDGCVKYSALVLADGRLNAFTVGGAQIDETVTHGKGKPVPLGDLGTIEYLSRGTVGTGNRYVVNLHVTSGAGAITLNNATAVLDQGAGPAIKAVERVGAQELDDGSDGYVTLVFLVLKDGPGSLDYSVTTQNGRTATAAVRIR